LSGYKIALPLRLSATHQNFCVDSRYEAMRRGANKVGASCRNKPSRGRNPAAMFPPQSLRDRPIPPQGNA
jgi:hypothetical protein